MDNKNAYKGLFYGNNEEDEPQFYEGGAHFSYNELCKILEKIVKKEKNEYEKDLVINIFNLNNKGKSRNVIIDKNNSNHELDIKKEDEEEKNSEKNIILNKNYKAILNKKKTLAISSFTITEKKTKGILNINVSMKKQNEKMSPDKVYNNRPLSINTKQSKINNKKNVRNELNLKGKKRNGSVEGYKKIEYQKLSFSCQNVNKISFPANNSKSRIINNKNYLSPINNKLNEKNKNKVLNGSSILNTTLKENSKIKNKDFIITSLKDNKNKSRNLNSQIQIANVKNEEIKEQNSKRKCSKTFHNESLINNKSKIDNNIQIEKNIPKDKPNSSDKTIITKNKINNKKNNDKQIINISKKINNTNNIKSIFHHPKNSYNKIQNIINSKKVNIYNLKPVEVSHKNSIRSSYNINTQISSRNKTSNPNKTSINQFSLGKSQIQNLQFHFSKNSTANTLTSNTNCTNKNIINQNIINKNLNEKQIVSYNNIINSIKTKNSKGYKSNLIINKIKSKEKN